MEKALDALNRKEEPNFKKLLKNSVSITQPSLKGQQRNFVIEIVGDDGFGDFANATQRKLTACIFVRSIKLANSLTIRYTLNSFIELYGTSRMYGLKTLACGLSFPISVFQKKIGQMMNWESHVHESLRPEYKSKAGDSRRLMIVNGVRSFVQRLEIMRQAEPAMQDTTKGRRAYLWSNPHLWRPSVEV
ncbi:hypothetical protein Egran_04669 [Elaphomyces granulatus]|uniref:Uncharacterized protein n=1 Tax=Elaphomyces granulatus TaxID=519963 RepID=A0A232LTY0_9EURO|nr:hypothetical protein Egran_04669 [Elaphomyces granulatus]